MQAAGRSGLRSARSSGRPAGTMQKEPLHMRQPQQPAPAAERAAGGHGTRPAPSTPGRRRRAPEMPGLPGWWPGEAAAAGISKVTASRAHTICRIGFIGISPFFSFVRQDVLYKLRRISGGNARGFSKFFAWLPQIFKKLCTKNPSLVEKGRENRRRQRGKRKNRRAPLTQAGKGDRIPRCKRL